MPFKNYDLSVFTNTTGDPSVALVQGVSSQTNYLPGVLIVFTIYLIMFMIMKIKGNDTVAAFASSNLVIFLICLLFFALAVIPGWLLVLSIILLVLSILMLFVA